VLSLAWSPDGLLIASGCTAGLVQIWEPATGTTVTTYRGHKRFVRSIAWSPDGLLIASGGDFGDSTIQVWEPHIGQPIYTCTDQYRIFSLSWSPDGTRIVSASFDGSVVVRAAMNGTPQFSYREHNGPVYAVGWSPDGTRIASAGQDATVHVWSPGLGVGTGCSDPMYRVGGGGDGARPSAWSPGDGQATLIYKGHSQPVKSLSWSPDSRMIASAGDDGSVQIWEADSGKLLAREEHQSWVRAVSWSPDGTRIASASGKIVRIDQPLILTSPPIRKPTQSMPVEPPERPGPYLS
jgi:WD40 repeat protein